MIPDLILGALVDALAGLIGLLPNWTVPSVLTSLDDQAATMGNYASSMAQWIPMGTIVAVVSAVGTVFALAMGARFSLWLWSKVPLVGS